MLSSSSSAPKASSAGHEATLRLCGEAVLQRIGNTPLLPLDALTRDYPTLHLLGKAEWYNPGGSIKDRAVASIVAEAVSWGDTKLTAEGIGAYVADNTAAGNYPKIVLGIAVMSLFVTLFNRFLWRPLYAYAEDRLRLD